jgi:hypothetical protein
MSRHLELPGRYRSNDLNIADYLVAFVSGRVLDELS